MISGPVPRWRRPAMREHVSFANDARNDARYARRSEPAWLRWNRSVSGEGEAVTGKGAGSRRADECFGPVQPGVRRTDRSPVVGAPAKRRARGRGRRSTSPLSSVDESRFPALLTSRRLAGSAPLPPTPCPCAARTRLENVACLSPPMVALRDSGGAGRQVSGFSGRAQRYGKPIHSAMRGGLFLRTGVARTEVLAAFVSGRETGEVLAPGLPQRVHEGNTAPADQGRSKHEMCNSQRGPIPAPPFAGDDEARRQSPGGPADGTRSRPGRGSTERGRKQRGVIPNRWLV